MKQTLTIRGRAIDHEALGVIKCIIRQGWDQGRTWISRELCKLWDWRQPNGLLKDQICRILLNELARRDLVELPLGKRGVRNGNDRRRYYVPPDTPPDYPQEPLAGILSDFPAVHLRMVRRQPEEKLWNHLVHLYHYQGYRIIVGSHLKYMAFIGETPVACLSWGSSVFRIQTRDLSLGWTPEARSRGIRYIANNTRFLILPWVKIKNLASHLLAQSVRVVSQDWRNCYGHPLYLLETFVETERFRGTCYRAANWVNVGSTKGHAKRDGQFYYHGNRKDVYLYPLVLDWRECLAKAGGES